MDLITNIGLGFRDVLQPMPLLMSFVGVTIGTFVGVLPGIGTLAAVSLLLPVTYHLDAASALIVLAGIFYGSLYGSSTSSILLNIPGSPASAVTALEGYPMARNGKAGVALFVSTICSFIAGSIGILLMMGFAPLLAQLGRSFGAPEYFAALLLALVATSTLSAGSVLKCGASILFGLLLGMVGVDPNTGTMRFTFGLYELSDGFSIVALAMGLFGVSEILMSIGQRREALVKSKDITFASMLPSKKEMSDIVKPTGRGTLVGFFLGVLPGAGPTISSFLSYALERRMTKDSSRFGKGAIEGLAAPEAANNAAVQAGFIPTLTLGIPGDAVMAILLSAMMIHGITPGPMFVASHPELFWGLIASFWVGNVILLFLNIPLIRFWVKILTIPYSILYPAMLFLIAIGSYSVNNSVIDVYQVIAFGVIGFFMVRSGFSPALTLLGFVLGPLIEQYFRRSLLISQGEMDIFLQSKISSGLLLGTLVLLVVTVFPVARALSRKAVGGKGKRSKGKAIG